MVATVDSTPWLTEARKFVGLREIIGSKHEAKILQFFAEAGHPNVRDDETSWCAAFANAMLVRSGYAGTGSLLARSFLTWGTALDKPVPGCIVVFKRGNEPWMGHVGFFVDDGMAHVRVLGGNQGNAVSIIPMPKADVLGYRWPSIKHAAPKAEPKPALQKPGKGAIAAGGGAVATGGAAKAIEAGWSVSDVVLTLGALVLLGVAAYLAWRWWQNREPAAPAAPTAYDLLDDPETWHATTDTLVTEDAAAPPPTGDPSPAVPAKAAPARKARPKPAATPGQRRPKAASKPAKPAAKKRRA